MRSRSVLPWSQVACLLMSGPRRDGCRQTPENDPPLTGRFRRRADIAERQLDGKFYLADNAGGTITVLNQMAAAIWRALGKPATIDELVDLAALAFPETDRVTIEADVGSILRDFLSEDLIVPA